LRNKWFILWLLFICAGAFLAVQARDNRVLNWLSGLLFGLSGVWFYINLVSNQVKKDKKGKK
jgi:threonine/homoserine/homoserine lactone efflux protein